MDITEAVINLKGICAILTHMIDTEGEIQWTREAMLLLSDDLTECIEVIEDRIDKYKKI